MTCDLVIQVCISVTSQMTIEYLHYLLNVSENLLRCFLAHKFVWRTNVDCVADILTRHNRATYSRHIII